MFQPKVVPTHSASVPPNKTIEINGGNADSVSKISDAELRISTLESQMGHFHKRLTELKRYSKREAQKQSKTLSQILALLGHDNSGDTPSNAGLSDPSNQTNHLDQMSLASGSTGTAGHGS